MEQLDPEFQVLAGHPFIEALALRIGPRESLVPRIRSYLPPVAAHFWDRLESGDLPPWEFELALHDSLQALAVCLEEHSDSLIELFTAVAAEPSFPDFAEVAFTAWADKAIGDGRSDPEAALLSDWLEVLWNAHIDRREETYLLVGDARESFLKSIGAAGRAYRATGLLPDDANFEAVGTQCMVMLQQLTEVRYKPYCKLVHDLLVACGYCSHASSADLGALLARVVPTLDQHFPEYRGLIDRDTGRWRNAAAHFNMTPNYCSETIRIFNLTAQGALNWEKVVAADEIADRVAGLRDLVGIGGSVERALLGFIGRRFRPLVSTLVREDITARIAEHMRPGARQPMR